MFDKVLIANRGEIALRIHRACKEMGIETVAVHSEADADAMHVRLADESVCIGPPPAAKSYLNMPAILTAAMLTGADAIHPGIGFLAGKARFAEMVAAHGLTFIGPAPEHIRRMGDKAQARRTARELGLPVLPGSDHAVADLAGARAAAAAVGYPVLLKAVAGGGGHGLQIVPDAKAIETGFEAVRHTAEAAFGTPEIYVEKYLDAPRHIEIQILADRHGTCLHFGERDCSIQRRHQKLIEEAPSPALTPRERQRLGKMAAEAARKLGYEGVGTLEFLHDGGRFYFIEMNTRLQVEHTVTEMITGIDLVREQIRVAAGEPLDYAQKEIRSRGHAIECRITAEHPWSLAPCPGRVTEWHPPGGLHVRVDSALYAGYRVPAWYDSLIAKLIVQGLDRQDCLRRLARALDEFVIGGVDTTLELHKSILADPEFAAGRYSTRWLEDWLESRAAAP